MLSFPLKQQPIERRSFIVIALIVSAVAVAGILSLAGPLALLLTAGGACAGAIGLFLLRRPLIALYVAFFLRLIPWGGIGVEGPWGSSVAQNVAIVLAVLAWILHAPFQQRPIRWNWVCVPIALFIVWASVTLLWAPNIIAGLEELRRYSAGLILIFLVVNLVNSASAVDGMMRVLALFGWTLVILGFYALLFSDYHIGERLKVLDINENIFGVMLILMLPGVIWPALRSSGSRRILHFALNILYILCTLILVLVSGSRGSTLSLVIVLLAFWFWRPLRPWGIVGALLVSCMLASAPFLLDSLQNRSNENWGDAAGGREILWEAGLQLLEDHPLAGVGIGNGPPALVPYIAALTRDFNSRDDLPAHNPLIEVGIETGIFGMFVYASIVVVALWQFFRHCGRQYMREGALAAYFPVVLGCAAGYLVTWIKSGGMANDPTFFVLLALLIIPSQLSSTRTQPSTVRQLHLYKRAARTRFSQSQDPTMNCDSAGQKT